METVIQTDGRKVNPHPVCQVCYEKSSARLQDKTKENGRRVDLCKHHATHTKRVHKEKVEVIAVWNGTTMEDFDG